YFFVITNKPGSTGVPEGSLLTDLTSAVGDEEYDTLASIEAVSLTGGPSFANSFDVSGFTLGVLSVDGGGGSFNFIQAQAAAPGLIRSEEHTSELQSRSDLVCRLL